MHCDYCDERKGIHTIYNKIYGKRNRIVCETEHFSVFPCMGQLREGHLLIASKKHINAIGMLNENEIEELKSLVESTGEFFKEAYNKNILCFEHGVLSDEGMNGGCGIYHMHFHLVPVNDKEFSRVLDKVKSREADKVYSVDKLESTCQCVAEKKSYIFLSQIRGVQEWESYIINNNNNYFESQYMRKVVCEVFGKKEWDWRKIENEEMEFLKTLERSEAFFHK